MRNVCRLFSSAITAVFVVFPVAQAEELTLEQALGLAYATNPRLEAERAGLRAIDEDVAKALAGWRPSVDVGGSYGRQDNQTNTRVPLPIPNGTPRGRDGNRYPAILNPRTIPLTRQAKANVRAGRAQLTSLEQSVLYDAAAAYFDVVADETAVRLKQDHIDLLQQQLRATQQRFVAGDVTQTDLSQVDARLAAANADLVYSLAKLASSRSAFERAIGRPPEKLESAPRMPELIPNEQLALDRANQFNPDLIAAREQAAAADASVVVAASALMPVLSVQGQYRRSQDQIAVGVRGDALSVIAQFRMPLFQGGEEYAEVRKAKELRGRAAFLVDSVARQVQEGLHSSWQRQAAARDAIVIVERQVAANESAYVGVQAEARVGERAVLDVLNAAQELLSSRLSLTSSEHELYVSAYKLLMSTGDLTAVTLKLPVNLYDPQDHYNRDAARWIGFGR